MKDETGSGRPPDEAQPSETAVLLHDLRTPLAAMRTAAELIGGEPLTRRQADALHTLELAIDSLLALTRDALDGTLAVPRAGERDTARDVLDAVADLFEHAARNRGLTLSREISDELAGYGLAEPLALRRILSVLLDNALKYTDEGCIRLAAKIQRGGPRPELALTVADSGIGIEADERETLFRPRSRGRRAEGHAKGSGIGLWSASRLALACDGRLELIETSPAGSTFGLRLPLVAPSTAGPDDAASGEETRNEDGETLLVLVVDDSETNRHMMEAMLEAAGFRVVLAEGGPEALAILGKGLRPDCVLLDLTMPGMTGMETLTAIRANERLRALPVIGITAAAVPNRAGLERMGFATVLDRPVAPARLMAAIGTAVMEGLRVRP